jgi:hypothetical protein
MLSNLHSIYLASETRAKWSIGILLSILALAIVGTVFVSASLVIGIVAAATAAVITFFKPTWTLAALSVYLPFEPFLLKWVPDDLYVYARYGSEVLIYFLLAVVAWKIISGDMVWKRTPVDAPWVFFLFSLAASVIINFLPVMPAILGIRQIIRFILLFFITVQLAPSERWMRGLLKALGVILFIQVCLGAAQAVIGERLDVFLLPSERKTLGDLQLTSGTNQFWDPGQRVFGTLGRYDQLGTFMAVVMLVLVAMVYEKAVPEKDRIWLWGLLLASLPVLAMTYSRSAWFGFLLGFLFIGAYVKRDRHVLAAAVILPTMLLAYIFVTGLVVRDLVETSDQSLTNRFFEAFSYERWVSEYYGLGRLYWIVKSFTVVIPAAPIFGHGPGTYGGGAVSALHNTSVYDTLSLPFGVYGTDGYIDNNWLSLWGELGTVGIGVYIWMLVSLFLVVWYVYENSSHPETRAWALAACAIILAVSLNAVLATFFEIRTLAPYLWIIPALVVVQGQREKLL